MHILYFHQYFNTPKCAGGTRSYEMASELVRRGHEVTMICLFQGDDIGLKWKTWPFFKSGQIDGINVIQLNVLYNNYRSLFWRAIIFFMFALWGIFVALTAEYDLIFATSTPLTAAIPGIFARFFRQKPFVFEIRDLWPELPKAMGVVKSKTILGLMSLLEMISYRAADGCVALSPGMKSGIVKRCFRRKPVKVIPNGCDLEIFKPGIRAELNLPNINENDFTAIFTGAHGVANGLDSVLDAAKELKFRKRNDIKIFFVGDGKMKPGLLKRASEEKLDNCFFLDPVPKIGLANLLNKFDVGLMILKNVEAFYHGTSPNKFFDYISAGLPIVNNYPGWLAEMIKEFNCGIVVNPDNPKAFADALCFMADNPLKRIKYSRNSRRLAEEKFDRKILSKKFADFLTSFKK